MLRCFQNIVCLRIPTSLTQQQLNQWGEFGAELYDWLANSRQRDFTLKQLLWFDFPPRLKVQHCVNFISLEFLYWIILLYPN